MFKISSTKVLRALVPASLLLASSLTFAVSTGNSFGNNVTCTGTCYDFTVYDNAGTSLAATGTSKGYFEALVGYTSGTSLVTPTIQAMYFSATGIVTPGATTSSWAPIVNLNLTDPTYGSNTQTGFVGVSSNSLTGAANSLITSFAPSNNAGQFSNGTQIQFIGSNGDSYLVSLNQVSKSAGTATIFDQTTSTFLSVGGQLAYYSTSPIVNGVNTGATEILNKDSGGVNYISAFGGQIAPEMSPLMSFNVFALLGCLFLLFTSKKYVAGKMTPTTTQISIA